MIKKYFFFVCFLCCISSIYSQKLWNDPLNWKDNIVPDANIDVTLSSDVWTIPTGYTASCKKLSILGDIVPTNPNTELIVNGTLEVYDDFSMQPTLLTGSLLRSVKITIGSTGRLILKDNMNFKGKTGVAGDKVIDNYGFLQVTKQLKLKNADDGRPGKGVHLTNYNNAILSSIYKNTKSAPVVDTTGGVLVFEPNSSLYFDNDEEQYITDFEDAPNLVINGGGVVYVNEDENPVNISANIYVQNGVFDILDVVVNGNQTNVIEADSGAVIRVGGTVSFPPASGGVNEFSSANLKEGSTVVYYDDKSQNITPVNYWHLTIEDDGGSATKTVLDGVEVSGVLQVETSRVLDVSTGHLTIKSTGVDSNQTGMIGPVYGTITGDKIVVERYVDLTDAPNNRYGWNDWSSPIVGNTIQSWADCCVRTTGFPGSTQPSLTFNSVLFYDATTITSNKNQGWVGATNINNETGLGTGVRLYEGNFNNVLRDTGSIYVGDLTVNLDFKDISLPNDEGWNLLGNPYACPIDWSLLYANGTSGNILNSVWMYSNATGYYVYNGALGIGSGVFKENGDPLNTSLIPSHKAFWIKATESNVAVTFTEAMKNTGGAYYLKNQTSEMEWVRIKMTSNLNAYKSGATLVFKEGASVGVDEYDSKFLPNMVTNSPGIAFKNKDGENYSITTIPNSGDFVEIPLYTKVGEEGTYKLEFYELNEISSQKCMVLIDTKTNDTYAIRETPIVEVNLAFEDVNRFKLIVGSPLRAKKIKDVTCFGDNNGEIEIEWDAPFTTYYNVYVNNYLTYNHAKTDMTLSGLSGANYKITCFDDNNYCQGAIFETTIEEPEQVIASIHAPETVQVNDKVTFYNQSIGGTSAYWDFGDGNWSTEWMPSHSFSSTGNYQVNLTTSNENGCWNETTYHISVINGTDNVVESNLEVKKPYVIKTKPEGYEIQWLQNTSRKDFEVGVIDVTGKTLSPKAFKIFKNKVYLNTSEWSSGVYIVQITVDDYLYSEKLVK